MIYVTGDTHNLLDVSKVKEFIKNNHLTKKDYLIIVGDYLCPTFGHEIPYDESFHFWNNMPMNILFIDGNHENFYQLNKMPIEIWNGGKIHRLSDNIIHLMRGQVFTLENKTFFTMGGAISPDKERRVLGYSYFKEEDCSYEETNEALNNLEKVNNKVDIVLTHTIGDIFLRKNMLEYFSLQPSYSGAINNFLDYIEDIVTYNHWYFGHFHKDIEFKNHTLLYQKVKLI